MNYKTFMRKTFPVWLTFSLVIISVGTILYIMIDTGVPWPKGVTIIKMLIVGVSYGYWSIRLGYILSGQLLIPALPEGFNKKSVAQKVVAQSIQLTLELGFAILMTSASLYVFDLTLPELFTKLWLIKAAGLVAAYATINLFTRIYREEDVAYLEAMAFSKE